MADQLPTTPDGVPIADGFDFPVGPRGSNVDVFRTHKIDANLVDPGYQKSFGVWHPGEDWNGRGGGDTDLGDPIYAIAHGRVAEFGYYPTSWGNLILIEHVLPNGERVWSQYAHLERIMVQSVGQIVQRGQQIGTMGKGAKSVKYPKGRWIAHLHFEIRKNRLPIGNWMPMVRNRSQVLQNYHSPTPFIQAHRPAKLAAAYASLVAPEPEPQQPTQAQLDAQQRLKELVAQQRRERAAAEEAARQEAARQAQQQATGGRQVTYVVVDSQRTVLQAGFFNRSRTDNWFSAQGGFQGTMLWTYSSPNGETNWAEWQPKLTEAGLWQVWVYIPADRANTTNAQYIVTHAEGKSRVTIDQSKHFGAWVPLGLFNFNQRGDAVRLSDDTGESQKMIAFDAITWVKVR